MAHSIDFAGDNGAAFHFSPLSAVIGFLRSIVDANRFVREVETVTRFSDAKLAQMGVGRNEIVPFLARKSGIFSV